MYKCIIYIAILSLEMCKSACVMSTRYIAHWPLEAGTEYFNNSLTNTSEYNSSHGYLHPYCFLLSAIDLRSQFEC